jgi:hypothetical protein
MYVTSQIFFPNIERFVGQLLLIVTLIYCASLLIHYVAFMLKVFCTDLVYKIQYC